MAANNRVRTAAKVKVDKDKVVAEDSAAGRISKRIANCKLENANCKLSGAWVMTPEDLLERLINFAARVGKVVDALPDSGQ